MFHNAGGGSSLGDVLSLTLLYVWCLLSRSSRCLERQCHATPDQVSREPRCPHMCPWVGPHVPSFSSSPQGLPSPVEHLLPQAVVLPLSTVPQPHPCCLSYGIPLPGRGPPSGLCTGSPTNGCFQGSA